MSRLLWRTVEPVCGFTIPVRIQPKQRHKGNSTPLRTLVFERSIVSAIAAEAWKRPPYEGRVGLIIEVYWFQDEPDLSNCLKSLEDGMNGVIYRDDMKVEYHEECKARCTIPGDERAEIQILLL